jgi:hypothetical protein
MSNVLLLSALVLKIALAGECDNALPPSLSNVSKWLQRMTDRGTGAEFFGKLASGDQL